MESFPSGPRLRDWPLIQTDMDIRSPEIQRIGSNAFLMLSWSSMISSALTATVDAYRTSVTIAESSKGGNPYSEVAYRECDCGSS